MTPPLRWLAVLLGLGLPWLAHARNAEDLLEAEPPELVDRLRRDGVLVMEDVGGGADSFVVAYVIFARPRDRVLELLEEAERQPEYRPELRTVRTISTTADGRVDEQRLVVMFHELVYRLRYTKDPEEQRLEWRLDPAFDNDLERMEGFWELYGAADGTTLGRFGSRVNVGPAVPGFLQRGLSRRTVLRYVENTRLWVDSEGRWRP